MAFDCHQVPLSQQQRQSLRVLRQATVAHLGVAEEPLRLQKWNSTLALTHAFSCSAKASPLLGSRPRRFPGLIAVFRQDIGWSWRMDDNLQSLPTDDRIDQLFLDSAFSGRLSSNDLHMLVNYIRAMRDKVGQCEQYTIPKDQTGKFR